MTQRAPVLPLLLLALLGAAPAAAMAASPQDTAASSRIIVKWRNTTGAASEKLAATPDRIEALRNRTTHRLERAWNIGGGLSVVQLDPSLSSGQLAAALAAIRADPAVESAAPDERVKSHAYTPSDTLYSSQWYLQTGQPAAIRANEAWDVTLGSSTVIVAVLDTGVRFDHPDLTGKLLPGWDFVSTALAGNDGNGWDSDASDPGDFLTPEDLARPEFQNASCGGPVDSSWHGTRVSGLIGAASDNAAGIAGTGFNVRILPVRVLGKCGGYVSDVIAGMYWAAGLAPPPPFLSTPLPPPNTTPARILNMSLGTDTGCLANTDSAQYYRAAVRDLLDEGVLIVASTGNSGAAVGTPASCAGVLAVAGIRHAGTKVGYSNLGPEVGIAAPAGNCVLVPTPQDPNPPCLRALHTTTNFGAQGPGQNGYSSTTVQATVGTSFSTPLVSGTAALMLSVNPSLSPAQVIQLIKSSARQFPTMSDTNPQPPACVAPSVQPVQAAECICNTSYCGAGMLNAHAAVLAAQGAPPPPPDDDGGGGGDGAPLLPLLALLLWSARRRLSARAAALR